MMRVSLLTPLLAVLLYSIGRVHADSETEPVAPESSGNGTVGAEGLLSCDPPIVASNNEQIKVAFHGTTLDHTCENQSPPFDDARMTEYCNAFCSTQDQVLGVPLLLGTSRYGFNLDQIGGVCTDVMEHNPGLGQFCSNRRMALADIEVKSAQLCSRVAVFKAKQIAFRAAMQKEATDLRAVLVSTAFQAEVAAADDKVAKLRQKLELFKANVVQQGGVTDDLRGAMDDLSDSATLLQAAVNRDLPLFEEFVTQCNKLLLGTGSQQEFALDICPQTSDSCIDTPLGKHVACCCGVNPVVSPTQIIDGIAAALLNGGGYVSPGRRLQSTNYNVRAEARRMSDSTLQQVRGDVATLGYGWMFDELDQSVQARYPGYSGQCLGRRLQQVAPKAKARALQESEEEPRLNPEDSCTPPSAHALTGLKVALSNTTEIDMCHLQPEPLGNAQMQGQCDAFCSSASAVPLLIGTAAYGFNQSGFEAICLPPGGVLAHNTSKVQQCHSWSLAFRQIEEVAASFIEQLDRFTATRLTFEAQLRNVTLAIHQHLSSDAFQREVDRAIDKVQTLKDAIAAKLNDPEVSNAGPAMQEATQALAERANNLVRILNTNVAMMVRYLNECNDLFVGRGPHEEYLLDICPQQNAACVDHPLAGHVGCCCAYHPFTNFGRAMSRTTIDGIRNFPAPARVAPGRLLTESQVQDSQTVEDTAVVDIIAQSWQNSAADVAQITACAAKVGQAAVVTEHDQTMVSYYGENYCPQPSAAASECNLVTTVGLTSTSRTTTTTSTTTTSTTTTSTTTTSTTTTSTTTTSTTTTRTTTTTTTTSVSSTTPSTTTTAATTVAVTAGPTPTTAASETTTSDQAFTSTSSTQAPAAAGTDTTTTMQPTATTASGTSTSQPGVQTTVVSGGPGTTEAQFGTTTTSTAAPGATTVVEPSTTTITTTVGTTVKTTGITTTGEPNTTETVTLQEETPAKASSRAVPPVAFWLALASMLPFAWQQGSCSDNMVWR